MATNEEMETSIIIKAKADDQQIKKEVDRAADTAQKELDKDDLKMDLQIEKAKLQKNLDLARAELKMFKKTGDKELELQARLNIQDIEAKIKNVNKGFKDLEKNAEDAAGDDNKGVGKLMGSLKNTAIWTAVISFVIKLTEKLIDLGTKYNETAEIFNRFTGDAEKTKELMDNLRDFSSENWLNVDDVRDTAAALLQMGDSTDEVMGKMQALGDIAAGTGTNIKDLADILGDIAEDWNLTKDTFNDLVKAGVPIGDQLAKDLNTSVEQVKKLASQGKITDEQVSTAFQHMSEEGGVFAGAMDQYASSFEGKMNTFKSTLAGIGESIANSLAPAFEGLMEDVVQTGDDLVATGSQGASGLEMIQKALFVVVQIFRGAIKIVSSFGKSLGNVIWGSYTLLSGFITDIGTNFKKLFNGDAWASMWDNLAYGIGKWVNGAIGYLNKLIDQINKIPGMNIGKVGNVDRGKKTDFDFWFNFSNTKNALNGVVSATKDTIDDITDDWSDYFTDFKDWWNNAGKTVIKEQKKTNATLKDLITGGGSGSWGGKKNSVLETQKENLKKLRDLKIQEIQESEAGEKEKNEKLLEVYNWYKDELVKLEGKTNDELLKSADEYVKEYYDKMQKASEKEQKATDDAIKSAKKYQDAIEKLGDKWTEFKDKALKNIREVNNSLEELDKDFTNDLAGRYKEVNKTIQEFEREHGQNNSFSSISLDELRNREYGTIWGVKIDEVTEYVEALQEAKLINEQLTEEQKQQVDLLNKQSETEKIIAEYQERKAQLEEQRNIYQAVANQWDLDAIGKKAIEIEGDVVKYYDATKDEYVKITDFKNQELARDLLNQQTKLETEYKQQETALQNELKLVQDHSKKVLDQRQSDTKAYKLELKNREQAVRDYVASVQELLASIPAEHRAYWGELSKGVTIVGENWPEAIVRRTASYVQPRNAVSSYSTVNNNQSSFAINWLNVNVSNVDEFLGELKNRLTYRN